MPLIKPHQLRYLLRRRLPSMAAADAAAAANPTPKRTLTASSFILSGAFPFKFRYMGLNPKPYSSRPFRTREPENRGPKSLIEDEEELSNWVSVLRTGSNHAGLMTDEEEEEERRGTKGRKREREKGRGEGDLGSLRRDGKRVRFGEGRGEWPKDDDSRRDRGRFGDSRVERSRDEGSRRDRGRTRGAFDDDEGIGGGGRELRRGGMRKGRDDDFGKKGALGMGNSRHSGGKRSSFRGRIESEDDLLDDDDDDDEEEEEEEEEEGWDSKRKKGGGKGGGRQLELRRGSDRGRGRGGGRGEKGNGRAARVASEDETDANERKSVSSFMDLIGEESEEEGKDVDEDAADELENKSKSSLFAKKVVEDSAVPCSQSGSDSYLSETRFDQCAVSHLTLKGIKDAGYERMTWVQEATLPVILKGKDVMAKAKTGTGKTVAFLLPTIEVVVNSPAVNRDDKRSPVLVVVICPTRELATQAAVEANKLLKYHPSIGVQVVMGGTSLGMEQKRIQNNPCQILVATPGRLKDHLQNTSGFATRVMGVKVLVLDEADRLLDMGFRKDLERIIAALPKQRQTLLFSATIPEDVRRICHMALKTDHEFINTVQKGSEDTHSQVKQMHLAAPMEKHFSLIYFMLKEHIADDVNYKVIVFCSTAMVTRLLASLLSELNLNVREIHSRKPQGYRTRVSDEFRKSKGLILVTSDVSARGVDYPDVTLVIQLGVPSDREQYIHRLGRTGRKGKEGQGILLLAPWEDSFLSAIRDLSITKAPVPSIDPDVTKQVERALAKVETKDKERAYQAWLGYYNSSKVVGRDKYRLVELANEFSRCMGLDIPPAVPKQILGKMGLKNIPGLRSK
ncbi:DEAD-box ATP-dependent RNA helicase 26-like protein [Drosera capensis]